MDTDNEQMQEVLTLISELREEIMELKDSMADHGVVFSRCQRSECNKAFEISPYSDSNWQRYCSDACNQWDSIT